MPLESMVPMLQRARAEGYAVGLFNVHTVEGVVAVLETAGAQRSPVILAPILSAPRLAMAALIRGLAARAPVPVALHLDHGNEFDQVVECIRCGFTDVMLDASAQPYEENAALTTKVVEAAHAVGMGVEAELGHVGQGGDYADEASRKAAFTKPDDAKRFVAETGVDALAVAIGSAHGVYKGNPELDLDLLARIRDQVDVPLVLHGGSGISDDDFRAAIRNGISKVNIYTAMSLAVTAAVHAGLEDGTLDSEGSSYSDIQDVAQSAVAGVVAHHMQVFGSVGKA